MRPLDYFYDNPINKGKGTIRRFDNFFSVVLKIVFKLAFRCKVRGAQEVCSLDEGFILAGNHRSYLDPIFVMTAMRPRTVRFIAKREFLSIFGIRRVASWLGVFPVTRDTGDIKVVKRSVAMLKRGEIVGIFPEGTRGRSKDLAAGKYRPHDGVALIASLAKARVVPCRLWNTEKISPEGSKRWHFPKVKLAFGEPMSLDDPAYADLEKSEKLSRFTQDIMTAIYSLPEPE